MNRLGSIQDEKEKGGRGLPSLLLHEYRGCAPSHARPAPRPGSDRAMSATVATLLGAAGAVAALLAVLVPLLLAQGRRVDRFEARVVARFEALTADVGEVRRDLHALAERVARIEGAMSGPWRPPANGTPASSTAPEATP